MKRHNWRVLEPELRKWIEVDLRRHRECAVHFGSTAKQIHRACKRLGICSQPRGMHGAAHGSWNGGVIVDKDGYRLHWIASHPYRRKHTAYILEHRLVMEKHLGRYLLPGEVVHHKNKNKLDNRIENLVLFDCNARHLASELKGQCPKWTPEGRARILVGVKKSNAIRQRTAVYARLRR